MDKIKKILKAIGYSENQELVEFWFSNEEKCIQKLNSFRTNWGIETSMILRWQTPLGKRLEKEVKSYIENAITAGKALRNRHFPPGRSISHFIPIDFKDLMISVDNETKSLNEWLNSILEHDNTYYGIGDLRGINLKDIRLDSVELSNAIFAYSNFTDSILNNVKLKNCMFQSCDFTNAFIGIFQHENSTFSDSNFSGAKVEIIKLEGNTFGTHPIYSEISQCNLILTAIAGRKVKLFSGHTEFGAIETGSCDNGNQKKHLSYISWYQDTMIKFTSSGNSPFKTAKLRLSNFFSAILTKNWQSVSSIGVFSLIMIFLFGCIYYIIGSRGFDKGFDSLLSAIYYSVITFSTLGYGDIVPKTESAVTLLLVMTEVLSGYVLLGLFLFMLSIKINERRS